MSSSAPTRPAESRRPLPPLYTLPAQVQIEGQSFCGVRRLARRLAAMPDDGQGQTRTERAKSKSAC